MTRTNLGLVLIRQGHEAEGRSQLLQAAQAQANQP
jgi:hypothetical protein